MREKRIGWGRVKYATDTEDRLTHMLSAASGQNKMPINVYVMTHGLKKPYHINMMKCQLDNNRH